MKKFLRPLLAGLYAVQLMYVPAMAEDASSVPALTGVRADEDQVILELSQLMPYDVFTLSSPWRLVIEVPGTMYKAGFSKKNVDGRLIKRIRGYQFKESPLITRIVVDVASPVDYKTSAEGGQVTISLKENKVAAAEAAAEDKAARKTAAAKRTVKNSKQDLLTSLPREEVTLDFESADIRDVVRLMAETSNINIIFGPEVNGTISVHLKRVPFDEAFSTILNLKGLVAAQLGANILRVTTPDLLQRERQKAIMFTKTIPINYLKADEMQKHLQAVMVSTGRRGTITVVSETNSLVVTDTDEGLGLAERLIAQLDKRPKQVMIEARIVEINLNNGFDIGVQWEFTDADTKVNGSKFKRNFIGSNAGDLARQSITPGAAAIGDPQTRVDEDGNFGPGSFNQAGTGVSLPGPTNAGITFGFVDNNTFLTASLAALINQSKAKILSAPKVVTINGESAKIEAVQDIRFRTSTVSNGVVSTDFKTVSAGIILNVTPTINAEDRITLRITPESSFPTQESTEAGPIIRTRTAQTTVVIKDGDTLVIGGLIDDQDSKGVSKVPILGDIPILGAFFRSQTNRKIRNELLVFVTPRIVRD
jgi:type IV pilus assembly protein PilQ